MICNIWRLGQARNHLWEEKTVGFPSTHGWHAQRHSQIAASLLPSPSIYYRNERVMRWLCLPLSGRHHTGILRRSNKTGTFCYTKVWVPVERKTAKVLGLGEVWRRHVPCPLARCLQPCRAGAKADSRVSSSHTPALAPFQKGSPQGYIFLPHSATKLCEYHLIFSIPVTLFERTSPL